MNLYVWPSNKLGRVCVLAAAGFAGNIGGYLLYAPVRAWGRRAVGRRELLLYGAAKRGVLLLRMLGYAAEWTGLWDGLDMLCCPGGRSRQVELPALAITTPQTGRC
jgi:hypothetical protein